jgi:hypothetical protein
MTTESPKPSDEAEAGALLPPATGSARWAAQQVTKAFLSATDTNYYAKATAPAGNPWRTTMMTESQAVEKAEWFVSEWLACGLKYAEATVFYRDGRVHRVVSPNDRTERRGRPSAFALGTDVARPRSLQ